MKSSRVASTDDCSDDAKADSEPSSFGLSKTEPSARPVVFGEILLDVFEDGSRRLGGAPFNVAWNLRALGFDPLLVSRVGNDPDGARVRQAMSDWGLDLAGLQTDAVLPTGEARVRIENGEADFEVLPGRAFDRIEAEATIDLLPRSAVACFYHGTLAARSSLSRKSLVRLRDVWGALRIVDLNLRESWCDPSTARELSRGATILRANEREMRLLGTSPTSATVSALAAVRGLCTSVGAEWVVVTRGSEGGIAIDCGGDEIVFDAWNASPLVDCVGAGDAFTAYLIAGALDGWPEAHVLERAARFAAAVCGLPGAIIAERSFYEPFRLARAV